MSSSSTFRPSRPGCGTNSASSPSIRIAARRRRISARAVRPARSTPLSASRSSALESGEPVPDRTDLKNHHADSVGDDVVELTCDSRALLRDGDPRSGLTITFGLRGARLRRLGLLGALAQRVARDPRDHEAERNEDEIADGLRAGDVVDDGHHRDQHDDQARAGLQRVPQVSEQERASQADDAEAADESEQQSVGERDRNREEPVGSRGGEREAATREERQHENAHHRYRDPERRRWRARRVTSDHELEHPDDRQGRDQQLEPVRACKGSDPAHGWNVPHVFTRCLLPE